MTAGRDAPDPHKHPDLDLATQETVPPPLRIMLARAAHAMVIVDGDTRVVECNPRAEALLDCPSADLRGKRVATLVRDVHRHAVESRIHEAARGVPAPDDIDVELRGDQAAEARVSISFLPFDGSIVALLLRDLTREHADRAADTRRERDALAEQTREHRKMAELGRLISGIAHELRTPLTYITNTLELERSRLEEVARDRPDLQPVLEEIMHHHRNIGDGLARVTRLVRDLRPLTKNRVQRPEPVDLAELVVEAVRTFRGAYGDGIRIELDLQATHRLPIDREDMHNVLLNLLTNASHALRGRGSVRITTRNATVPPEIRVIDHGPGVAPEIRDHLFEPFRTTRVDGTGLGLFISRRTVEAAGGTLTHEETPGGGATFVVQLPTP